MAEKFLNNFYKSSKKYHLDASKSALDGKEESEPQQKGTQSGNIEVKLMSPVFTLMDRKKCKIIFKNITVDIKLVS